MAQPLHAAMHRQARKTDMGKFVLVLRRVDGRWLIAADIENANMQMRPMQRPAKPPADQRG